MSTATAYNPILPGFHPDSSILRVGTDFYIATSTLTVRPGWLRLSGRESLGSLFEQALLARRQQAFIYRATTCVDFQANGFQQMAGLVCYYNGRNYFYLHTTRDQQAGRILDLSVCDGDWHCDYPVADPVRLPADGPVWLSVEVDYDRVRFLYGFSESAKEWQALPGVYDYSILSDEVGEGSAHANLTGAFVGICCQDLSGTRQHADFDFFSLPRASFGSILSRSLAGTDR